MYILETEFAFDRKILVPEAKAPVKLKVNWEKKIVILINFMNHVGYVVN